MPVPLLNQPFSKWAQANIGVSIHLQEDFCVCLLPIKLVNIFCVVCRMPVGIINLGIPQCPFLHFAKSGVQVTSASGKSRLASVGRIFKFRGAKTPQTVDTQGFQPMASILFAGSGGGEGSRTPVRKQFHGIFSGRRRLFREAKPSPFPFRQASRHVCRSGESHDAWHGQLFPYARSPLNDALLKPRYS